MTPWSVSPKAGWSSSAARAAIASILQAPSSSEYSLWACRCTAEALLTGPSIMPIRADGTGAFRDASARFACYLQQDREDRADHACPDARKERGEADDHRPLHRIEALVNRIGKSIDPAVNFDEAGFHLSFNPIESLVNLVEPVVDVIKPAGDLLLEVIHALGGPCFSCHHSHGSD